MMLSRVAERLYWMARYLERAEDNARLINAYSQLVLDIPRGLEPGWDVLIKTMDAGPAFRERYKKLTEANVIRFMLANQSNLSSIRYSIQAARENVRTTRDVLPAQAWELMNELYLYVNEAAGKSLGRAQRFDFLETVIARNQQINGLIDSSVSRDHPYWFIRIGQLVERADMTSRIVDVATAAIGARTRGATREIPLLWANLLKSLSATAAYRRQVGPVVTADQAIQFVLKAPQFPRSIVYCLDNVEETMGHLKAPAAMFRNLRSLVREIGKFRPNGDSLASLHALIDEIQRSLADLHGAISEAWFLPVEK